MKNFNKLSFTCLTLFFYLTCLAQDSIKQFDQIEIKGERLQFNSYYLSKEDISKLNSYDLGHLLLNSPSISLNDYGGIGSLKTLSFRGLGTSHTNLIINNQVQNQSQNGIYDLGSIQIDNLESVSVELGVHENELIPISAIGYSNIIQLKTFENSFSKNKHAFQLSSTYGSFNQLDNYVGYKLSNAKMFYSISSKYRFYDGDYRYLTNTIYGEELARRTNNSGIDFFTNVGFGIKSYRDSTKNVSHSLKINYRISQSNKLIPGPVILYNNTNDESIITNQNNFNLNYSLSHKIIKSIAYAGFMVNKLNYLDPTFFNALGMINNTYINETYTFGLNNLFKIGSNLSLQIGSEYLNAQLRSISTNDNSSVNRNNSTSILGFTYSNQKAVVHLNLLGHYYFDQIENTQVLRETLRINPQFQITKENFIIPDLSIIGWAKKTLRIPTFNELYYSQIGSSNLIPEDAIQFNIGSTYKTTNKKLHAQIGTNVFYNLVYNKIISFPSQNLFVWSTSNIGRVQITGIDLSIKLIRPIFDLSNISYTGNFSFQNVIDISDKNSSTFGHQIMYTPKFTSNNLIEYRYKRFSFQNVYNIIGKRYSLNQNITSNLMNPFLLVDFMSSYTIDFKNNSKLLIQIGIRNLCNIQYSFIRNYPMPGRNYFIKLIYGLH